MHGGRAWSGTVRLVAGAVVAVALAGCSLFFPGYSEFEEFPEIGDEPTVAYTSGTATIEVDGTTLTLDELAVGGGEWAEFGASATWRGTDGWILQVSGALADGEIAPIGFSGYLTLHRIDDGQHWTTLDPGRCIVTIDRIDEDGMAGSATCRDLEWMDAIVSDFAFEPPRIEDQDAFDAEITFEASAAARTS